MRITRRVPGSMIPVSIATSMTSSRPGFVAIPTRSLRDESDPLDTRRPAVPRSWIHGTARPMGRGHVVVEATTSRGAAYRARTSTAAVTSTSLPSRRIRLPDARRRSKTWTRPGKSGCRCGSERSPSCRSTPRRELRDAHILRADVRKRGRLSIDPGARLWRKIAGGERCVVSVAPWRRS